MKIEEVIKKYEFLYGKFSENKSYLIYLEFYKIIEQWINKIDVYNDPYQILKESFNYWNIKIDSNMQFEINLFKLTNGKIRGELDIMTSSKKNNIPVFIEIKIKRIKGVKFDLRALKQINEQLRYIRSNYERWQYYYFTIDTTNQLISSIIYNERSIKDICNLIYNK